MQRLKDKIEKWFGKGAEYKGIIYDKYIIQNFVSNTLLINTNLFNKTLSINDLCSVECSFLQSLRRNKQYEFFDLVEDSGRSMEHYYGVQYHRMQLSLRSDEQKILYIINNTK